MLRAGEDVFLDDIRVGEVEEALGVPVIAVESDGLSLVRAVLQKAGSRDRSRLFRAYETGGSNE